MPRGAKGAGVLYGAVAVLLMVCEFLSGWDGYILRSWEFRQKSKDFKKCDVIQFLHIFIWEVKGWFRSDFVSFSAVMSLQGSARAIYNTIFRYFPLFSDLGEIQRAFKRDFGVLSGSGCRLAVGGGCWVRPILSSCEMIGYICIYSSVIEVKKV